MKNAYEVCPSFENEKYLLRFMELGDAGDLLKVYSDEKAVPYFNSDNCHGDIFFYETLERMKEGIKFWIRAYEEKSFVRWSIINQTTGAVIGTIELFHRQAEDSFSACGLLRLDLRSDYEREEAISEILALITSPTYELFQCERIATKAKAFATERIKALKSMGFSLAEESLIGHDGTAYGDYWVCLK